MTAWRWSSWYCGQQTVTVVDPWDDKAIHYCFCGFRWQSSDRTLNATELMKAAADKLVDMRTKRQLLLADDYIDERTSVSVVAHMIHYQPMTVQRITVSSVCTGRECMCVRINICFFMWVGLYLLVSRVWSEMTVIWKLLVRNSAKHIASVRMIPR